jgi:hypothetical protein
MSLGTLEMLDILSFVSAQVFATLIADIFKYLSKRNRRVFRSHLS